MLHMITFLISEEEYISFEKRIEEKEITILEAFTRIIGENKEDFVVLQKRSNNRYCEIVLDRIE